MLFLRRCAAVAAWCALVCLLGCVGPAPAEELPGESRPPLVEEGFWRGAGGPPPSLEQVEAELPGGLVLLASDADGTYLLAIAADGRPLGVLDLPIAGSTGIAWHSDGFLALASPRVLWRVDLEGFATSIADTAEAAWKLTEGVRGQILLAEEDRIAVFPGDPEEIDDGEPQQETSDPEGPPDPEDDPEAPADPEPAPCFMDVALDAGEPLALEVISGAVLDGAGYAVVEGLPDDTEVLGVDADGGIHVGGIEGVLRRADGSGFAPVLEAGDWGLEGFGVSAITAGPGGTLSTLWSRDGGPEGGSFAVLQRAPQGPWIQLLRGGGGWRDLAVVP